MIVVLNTRAGGGKAARRWPAVEEALRASGRDFELVSPGSIDEAESAIRQAVDVGHDAIVVAGGDGSVNLALNTLMDPGIDRPRRDDCALGALGLGSSNDLHKPFAREQRIGGVPARVDIGQAQMVDVGKATVTLADGTERVRYFILNASMGVIAAGNHSFNHARGLTAWLKPRNTEAAIAVTAVQNIARFAPIALDVHGEGWQHAGEITNVSVLKTVHFAGGMRYDTGVVRDDGRFDVNIIEPASRLAMVRLALGLYRGRFRASRYARCERADSVSMKPAEPRPLELDGEIIEVTAAQLDVLPKALRLCT